MLVIEFLMFPHFPEIFERANQYFKDSASELKEERAMLLEEWLNIESSFGELGDVGIVQSKLPKKLKKKRQITSEDGLSGYVANSLRYIVYDYLMFLLYYFVVLLNICLCWQDFVGV